MLLGDHIPDESTAPNDPTGLLAALEPAVYGGPGRVERTAEGHRPREKTQGGRAALA